MFFKDIFYPFVACLIFFSVLLLLFFFFFSRAGFNLDEVCFQSLNQCFPSWMLLLVLYLKVILKPKFI